MHPAIGHGRHARALGVHPSRLLDAALAEAKAELAALGSEASLFVGWQDEQHDQRQDLRLDELGMWKAKQKEGESAVAD